ncbi:hypothetical protein Micbo1qcDRAFT_52305 [Microdochium bolleyi]|uniref:Secreted protein n=1 Tax=Microdochium bolleyi TaxID=196109 RepID=A0A136J732_9PEZI|nr:hypothetical protein Micbo1qcDRAFT_52305 [Microdochium bolleyi]
MGTTALHCALYAVPFLSPTVWAPLSLSLCLSLCAPEEGLIIAPPPPPIPLQYPFPKPGPQATYSREPDTHTHTHTHTPHPKTIYDGGPFCVS